MLPSLIVYVLQMLNAALILIIFSRQWTVVICLSFGDNGSLEKGGGQGGEGEGIMGAMNDSEIGAGKG